MFIVVAGLCLLVLLLSDNTANRCSDIKAVRDDLLKSIKVGSHDGVRYILHRLVAVHNRHRRCRYKVLNCCDVTTSDCNSLDSFQEDLSNTTAMTECRRIIRVESANVP